MDYATKVFRHALALDERRVRFQPQTWNAATSEREQELDVDEPIFPTASESDGDNDYKPPNRDVADVKEVWFAGGSTAHILKVRIVLILTLGCHADIGGGSHHDRFQNSLSYIPFRWMVDEVQSAQCGINFVEDCIRHNYHLESSRKLPDYAAIHGSGVAQKLADSKFDFDIVAQMYDQLDRSMWWWILELLPLLTTYQHADGDWFQKRRHVLFFTAQAFTTYSVNLILFTGETLEMGDPYPTATPIGSMSLYMSL